MIEIAAMMEWLMRPVPVPLWFMFVVTAYVAIAYIYTSYRLGLIIVSRWPISGRMLGKANQGHTTTPPQDKE